MQSASLQTIKKELGLLTPNQLKEVCLRLAKYKKENKELLTYILFESDNDDSYIKGVKEMIEEQFLAINKRNTYLAKKSIRKGLKITNKFIKYSQSLKVEVELRIYFCQQLKDCGISLRWNPVLSNLFNRQKDKIESTLNKMHEDLRFDYQKEFDSL